MTLVAALLLTAAATAAHAQSSAPKSDDTPPVELKLDTSFTRDLRLSSESEPQEKVKPDIHYVPTPEQLVDVMLQMADVKSSDRLYDLGSGDGRLVITAAKNFGARGIGIDIDPERIAEAKNNAAAAGVEDRVEFRQADLFTSNFKDASVITLYLLDTLNRRLRPQIFAQVKPGTRVVSHAFSMGDWEPDAERTLKIRGAEYTAYYWMVPANISGRWKVTADQGTKGMPDSLVVEQAFQKFTVRDAGAAEVIGEGRLSGNEFTLTFHKLGPGGTPTSFTGVVEATSIKATPSAKGGSWRAEREPGTEKPIDPDTPAAR